MNTEMEKNLTLKLLGCSLLNLVLNEGNILAMYVEWLHSTCITESHLCKPSSFVPILILESFPLSCRPVDENISNPCSYVYVTHPITYSMITMCPSHRVKQLVCEADHSLPSSAKVKNEWNCTSALPCIFKVCRGIALPLSDTVASKLNYAIRPIDACIFHNRPNFHLPSSYKALQPI